jgi:hypothetical protein
MALALSNVGQVLLAQGRAREAEPYLRQAVGLHEKHSPRWLVGDSRSDLGASLTAQRHYREADSLLISGYTLLRENLGEEHRQTSLARQRLATNYDAWGKPGRAAQYRLRP